MKNVRCFIYLYGFISKTYLKINNRKPKFTKLYFVEFFQRPQNTVILFLITTHFWSNKYFFVIFVQYDFLLYKKCINMSSFSKLFNTFTYI